jgi:hypothetical protein
MRDLLYYLNYLYDIWKSKKTETKILLLNENISNENNDDDDDNILPSYSDLFKN